MTVQRRRGVPVTLYPSKTSTDARGNTTLVADLTAPYTLTAAVIPQRSYRAEVPGQRDVDVYRLLVSADIENVDIWSRASFYGEMWDVISPPRLHRGIRKTRHYTIDVRKRP